MVSLGTAEMEPLGRTVRQVAPASVEMTEPYAYGSSTASPLTCRRPQPGVDVGSPCGSVTGCQVLPPPPVLLMVGAQSPPACEGMQSDKNAKPLSAVSTTTCGDRVPAWT